MRQATSNSPSMPARGYTHIEVLVAMVLIATSLAPMVESVANAVRHQDRQQTNREIATAVQSRMAAIASERYAALDAEALAVGDAKVPSSYSDLVGTANRRLVFLARYDLDDADGDADPLTGGDSGLLWIRVAVENTAVELQTLKVAP